MAPALQNNSPIVVLGGRAAGDALGAGLAAGDRPRAVRAPARRSSRETAEATADDPAARSTAALDHGARAALGGPTFVDFPLDVVFMEAEAEEPTTPLPEPGRRARRDRRDRARGRAAARRRAPGDHGRHRPLLGPRRGRAARARPRRSASRSSSTAWRAAACPPTTSCSSAARAATALKGADVALVIGVPLDFRLGFGGVVRRGRPNDRRRSIAPSRCASHPRAVAAELVRRRSPRRSPRCADGTPGSSRRPARLGRAAARRSRPRSARPRTPSSPTTASPLHPMRIYARARRRCSTATRS